MLSCFLNLCSLNVFVLVKGLLLWYGMGKDTWEYCETILLICFFKKEIEFERLYQVRTLNKIEFIWILLCRTTPQFLSTTDLTARGPLFSLMFYLVKVSKEFNILSKENVKHTTLKWARIEKQVLFLLVLIKYFTNSTIQIDAGLPQKKKKKNLSDSNL